MQFSTLLAAASSLVALTNAATIQNFVTFNAESDNQEINGKGLFSTHEGAAINYFFLGSDAQTLDYNTTNGVISHSIQAAGGDPIFLEFGVNVDAPFPTLEVSGAVLYPTNWTIDGGYLKGNGSQNFYVAKNTNDPYRYSEDSYQVALFPEGASTSAFTDVHPIKIKATRSATL